MQFKATNVRINEHHSHDNLAAKTQNTNSPTPYTKCIQYAINLRFELFLSVWSNILFTIQLHSYICTCKCMYMERLDLDNGRRRYHHQHRRRLCRFKFTIQCLIVWCCSKNYMQNNALININLCIEHMCSFWEWVMKCVCNMHMRIFIHMCYLWDELK